MKRQLPWIVVGLIAVVVAAALLRRQPAVSTSSDREVNTEGHFASDSLGVSLLLPNSPGWSFRREPPIPGEPYMSAVHAGENAIVKLYASRTTPGIDLDEVVDRRRAHLASFFGVPNLDDAMSEVMQNARTELNGHPTLQWQAMTKVMGAEGEPTVQIMFLWVATVQPEWVFECLGMLRFPAAPTPEEQQVTGALMHDMASIVESFRVR